MIPLRSCPARHRRDRRPRYVPHHDRARRPRHWRVTGLLIKNYLLPVLAGEKGAAGGAPPASSASQRLVEIGDQIVRIFDADGQADQSRRDSQAQLFLGRNVGMGHRGRMRGQSLGSAQTDRKLDHFELSSTAKASASPPFTSKRRSSPRSCTGVRKSGGPGGLRAGIPDTRQKRLTDGREKFCHFARAGRRGGHPHFQGFEERIKSHPVCGRTSSRGLCACPGPGPAPRPLPNSRPRSIRAASLHIWSAR